MSAFLYAVYGASGFGRQVMPIARKLVEDLDLSQENLVFVDDAPAQAEVNGHKVMRYSDFVSTPVKNKFIIIAIADAGVRERLAERCSLDGIKPWTVVAENSVITDDVSIGEGTLISHFSLLTCNIKIGRYFQANHYSQVSHDCVIGDYVTFAPGVRCNGNVWVEDGAYIGAGAIIKQGTPSKPLIIGKGAVVGMGAVVTKDVAPGVTVVGNPARPLVKA